MPTKSLTPIAGGPAQIVRAATALESIATEIASASAQLRSLATGVSGWSGAAASNARARSITVPPMLDKAHASYRDAGRALREYATALGSAQRHSAIAVRAAAIAQTALDQAKSAHEAAIARDAEAAKAAATAGLPPPVPTAQSLEQDIADASRQLSRAQQADDDAHDEAEHAARVAAASLHRASREGIRNKPWWRHVLHDAGHWAHAAWVGTLRFVAKVAVTVSAVAGLAALVLSVAGLFFAPLEVAAGALETVSFAAGSVALASQAALAITGDASWVSVGLDTLALLPAVGSKGTRALAGRLRRLKAPQRVISSRPSLKPRVVVHGSDSATVRTTPIRKVLPRPSVSDPKLRNIVNDLYKGTRNPGRVGNGTTADAIRYELATNRLTAGKGHIVKGREYARALSRWLDKASDASPRDRAVAHSLLDDLRTALEGK